MRQRLWKMKISMKVEKAKQNFEDSKFSYLVVRKSTEMLDNYGYGRIVQNPLKSKKTVFLDVCTPQGTLERIPVEKRKDNEKYRAARDAEVGQLYLMESKSD
jgi:ribosomal protein RSM22 (predicted rRNA methylase)